MEYDFSRLCFIDYETTGLKDPKPVSLGILHYTNGKLDYKNNILINPEGKIDDGAYNVHHISQDMVDDKPTFAGYWEELKPYMDCSNILLAHNSTYDIKVLVNCLHRYDLDYGDDVIKSIDTYRNAQKLIPKSEIKNYKLDTVAQHFGINFTEEQHHDAFFDTIACMKIYNKLIGISDGQLEIKETKI